MDVEREGGKRTDKSSTKVTQIRNVLNLCHHRQVQHYFIGISIHICFSGMDKDLKDIYIYISYRAVNFLRVRRWSSCIESMYYIIDIFYKKKEDVGIQGVQKE